MQNLQSILESRKIEVTLGRINNKYEEAEQYLAYLNIPHTSKDVIFLLKLFKKFGPQKMSQLQSFIKDYNNFDYKRWKGLFIWKLKQ